VKVNVYLTDLANFAKVNEIMATYISTPYPARAAIGVASLPRGAEVEIEGVMVLREDVGGGGS
jgi:enamine deaminase RidA (YjgF/YER057c/UK114 family)